MKILIVKPSPLALECPFPKFLPYCKRPCFTAILHNRQYYGFIYSVYGSINKYQAPACLSST